MCETPNLLTPWDPKTPNLGPQNLSPGTPRTTPQVQGGGIHHVGPQKPQHWDPKTSALTPQVLGGNLSTWDPKNAKPGTPEPQPWDPQDSLIWDSRDPKPPDPMGPKSSALGPPQRPLRSGGGGIHHVGPQKPQC